MHLVRFFYDKRNDIIFQGDKFILRFGSSSYKRIRCKDRFTKLFKKKLKTNDKSVRFHKDDENLMQMIYQINSAYSKMTTLMNNSGLVLSIIYIYTKKLPNTVAFLI